jgi:2TM domain
MADTPDPPTEQQRYEEARRRVNAKKGFYTSVLIYAVVNVVFLFVAGWDWLWVTLFWGIGLLVHAWTVFGQNSAWVKGWEQRQLDKELRRDDPAPPPAAG